MEATGLAKSSAVCCAPESNAWKLSMRRIARAPPGGGGSRGRKLPLSNRPRSLAAQDAAGAPSPRHCLRQLLVAVDVQNPLLGPRGATRVYGPQKGLRSRDFVCAERCLGRLAKVVKKDFGRDLARAPGAGAAGGLGFGLLAFLSAQLEPGFDLFARQAAVERHLQI